ncbi:hypothetical protein ACQ4PT_014070 [Festuca glaucescens]
MLKRRREYDWTTGSNECNKPHDLVDTEHFWSRCLEPQNKQGGGCTSDIMVRSTNNGVYLYANSHFNPQVPIDTIHKKLRSLGYPVPEKNCGGMKLINRFEEKFPYVDGSCRSVLKDLSQEVALNLSCSVVSLASFNGNTRLFACTGILIECTSVLTCASLVRYSDDENKIDDDLRIEVRLPNKQFVTGKLQHYSLHYNLAVVNIMASPDLHTANLYHDVQFEPCCKLLTSTCKITKAGIGGPLVDFDGNFIGMNFYDEENTPFIPRNIILECLGHFETKRTTIAAVFYMNLLNGLYSEKSLPDRWPVPKPYWVYPASDWDLGMHHRRLIQEQPHLRCCFNLPRITWPFSLQHDKYHHALALLA